MQFSKLDLNILRVLDALLAERSVTRAAKTLHVTQQAVSGSLRRLRETFNDPLLARIGREMELTPLASALANPLREALINLENILHVQPNFDAKTTARTFRVAISDYGCFVVMPRILRILTDEAPLIGIEVSSLNEHSFTELDRGDLDFLFTIPADTFWPHPRGESLCRRASFEDDFVCLADKNHPDLANGLTWDMYQALPHCAARFGTVARTLVDQAWKDAGLTPRVTSTAPGFAALIFMLPGTNLIGTVQRRLADALANALNLRVHECPLPISRVEEHVFWHDRNRQESAHQYLLSVFQRVATQLSALKY